MGCHSTCNMERRRKAVYERGCIGGKGRHSNVNFMFFLDVYVSIVYFYQLHLDILVYILGFVDVR